VLQVAFAFFNEELDHGQVLVLDGVVEGRFHPVVAHVRVEEVLAGQELQQLKISFLGS